MTDIQKEIINTLIHDNGSVLSQESATKLNVSKRTIKGNISDINEIYPHLISSSVRGYCIDKAEAQRILIETSNVPQTPKERIFYIVKKLLLVNTNLSMNVDIYDMSEELMVSEATIYKDLIRVRKYLKKYELDIASSKGKVKLVGIESKRRKAINDLYFKEIEKSEITFKSIQNTFPEYDAHLISDIILRTCKKYHYFILLGEKTPTSRNEKMSRWEMNRLRTGDGFSHLDCPTVRVHVLSPEDSLYKSA
ncbi:helix-turn-helix domain-containing protein [Amphibacillus sediminis]|uniref:helix-turn-helix domain-containing protein n=1 Tax=Amphibacillus sediminis TaxID=360185 RepID=UPI00082A752D|nr:helix-turn-helix domain-containing protein [Amphibacillus sediminis]